MTDDELRRRARRRQNRFLLALLALAVLLGCAEAVIAFGGPGALLEEPLLLAIVLLPIVVLAAAFVPLVRWQERRFAARGLGGPPLVAGVDRATRRRVLRAVRRGELPEDDHERAVAVDSARHVAALPAWMTYAMPLYPLPAAFIASGPVRWLFIGVVLVLAVAAVDALRRRRSARGLLTAAGVAA